MAEPTDPQQPPVAPPTQEQVPAPAPVDQPEPPPPPEAARMAPAQPPRAIKSVTIADPELVALTKEVHQNLTRVKEKLAENTVTQEEMAILQTELPKAKPREGLSQVQAQVEYSLESLEEFEKHIGHDPDAKAKLARVAACLRTVIGTTPQ